MSAPAAFHKRASGERTVHVIQGEFNVSGDPQVVLSTVLGSCVAVCMRDPVRKIGGMNHFLLPYAKERGGDSKKYGAFAMELLINKLLRGGAQRDRLEAKVFGGACITEGLGDIGGSNVEFARRFLTTESVPIVSESVGGVSARRVKFWPVDGRARQLLIAPDETLRRRETEAPAPTPADDDIEFF
ncbi:MAG: chemotaxis protein CheD [Pseudomonadota bacterium]